MANFRSHESRVHDTSGTHNCGICANVYKSKEQLRSHMRMHRKRVCDKVQCEVCGAWFGNKDRLKKHIERHNAQPVKCKKCDKIAPNPEALNSHMWAVHSDANFKCHLCPKAFKVSYALKVCKRFG